MDESRIFAFVRECQTFAGRSGRRYCRDRLQRTLRSCAAAIPREASHAQQLCITQILENLLSGLARHLHANVHREYGGDIASCGFNADKAAHEEWFAARTLSLDLAFLRSTDRFMDSLEAAHPVPASVRAALWIRSHFVEGVSVSALAHVVGCHPVALRGEFKQRYRMTIRQYQTRCRLRRAVALLKHTSAPVTEITERVGFGCRDHFYRAFAEWLHMTPAEYRLRFGRFSGTPQPSSTALSIDVASVNSGVGD